MANTDYEALQELRIELVSALSEAVGGECRKGRGETAPLHPVLFDDGTLRWCCAHSEEHCSQPVAVTL